MGQIGICCNCDEVAELDSEDYCESCTATFESVRELAIKAKEEARQDLRCPRCPPNKGDNYHRKAKHGPQKPKYKTSKRG